VTTGFSARYPVSLHELLLAPVVLREQHEQLCDVPFVSRGLLNDLSTHFGHRPGAVRTALSRLGAQGALRPSAGGYRSGALADSVSAAVLQRPGRPDGYVLAVFSFTTEDARERHVVREALKLHGFQKLAQNVYVNGAADTTGVEQAIAAHGLSQHLFLFRCTGAADPQLDRRLASVFDVSGRARALLRFERDLHALLDAPGLDDDELARRYLAACPVHYRITFAEEPPLPARCLPDDYPLARLEAFSVLTPRQTRALRGYYARTW